MSTVDDDDAPISPEALHRQLVGLNGLAELIATERAALEAAQAGPPEVGMGAASDISNAVKGSLALLKRKEETLRWSYSSLLHSAHSSFRHHVKAYHPLSPPSAMSPHLQVMERVWHSMCRHSQPQVTHFTMMVTAYGREARRTRIKDLYQRWLADKERHLQSQRGSPAQSMNDDLPVIEGVDPADVLRIKAKEARAVRARVLREKAIGFPIHRPLYPSVRLDTAAYNAIISSYTTSLAAESLTSSSPVLSFPFSLLSSFRADAMTFTILMSLHCRMRDTTRVLQLFEDFKRMRHDENAQLHGQRPLQHIRMERKVQSQYLHSILLRSLGQAGEVDAVERVWAGLKFKEEASQIEITRPIYHAMLEMYARRNEHEKMRALSVEMRRRGMELDADGVCVVIHTLCKAGTHRRCRHDTPPPTTGQSRPRVPSSEVLPPPPQSSVCPSLCPFPHCPLRLR